MHFHVIASDACVLLMGILPAGPGACCIPFPGLGSLRDMDDDRNRTAQGKPLRTGNEEPRDSASSLACLCGMSSASVRLACKEFLVVTSRQYVDELDRKSTRLNSSHLG